MTPLDLALLVVAAGCLGGPSGRVRLPEPAGDRPGHPCSRPPRRASVVAVGAVIALVAGLSVGLVGAAVVAALVGLATVRASRRTRRRHFRALDDELPLVVELYLIALRSGANVTVATRQVARYSAGPVGAELRSVLVAVDQGRLIGEVLEDRSSQLGAGARPLVAALVAAERWGVAVTDDLERLGADLRHRRRRVAEAEARRLPVLLLFPLVVCVLPAFGLLTVVPVLLDAVAGVW